MGWGSAKTCEGVGAKWSPRDMSFQVGAKAGRLGERLATAVTLVGLLSGVQPLVAAQRGGLGERSLAEFALVRFFASVDASVGPEAALRGEDSLTDVAPPVAAVASSDKHIHVGELVAGSERRRDGVEGVSSGVRRPDDGEGGRARWWTAVVKASHRLQPRHIGQGRVGGKHGVDTMTG